MMVNKITSPQYEKIKNISVCVVSFKNGIRTFTYGNLSYKDALEWIFKKQTEGETCLVVPSSNGDGVEGLENGRLYKEEEETLKYYLECLQGYKDQTNQYLREVGSKYN